MQSFLSDEGFVHFIRRLNNLQEDSLALWGSMNAAQMMLHLSLAIGCGLKKDALPDVSTFISRTFMKYGILYILPRFPKNAKTAKSLRVKEPQDFQDAKEKLFQILQQAYNTTSDSQWHPHPLLGIMSRKQWGILITKHLDHHLRQFGA